MLEVREEDELVPIPLRNVVLAIPKCKLEMRESAEDLTQMGCEGLLAKPCGTRLCLGNLCSREGISGRGQ